MGEKLYFTQRLLLLDWVTEQTFSWEQIANLFLFYIQSIDRIQGKAQRDVECMRKLSTRLAFGFYLHFGHYLQNKHRLIVNKNVREISNFFTWEMSDFIKLRNSLHMRIFPDFLTALSLYFHFVYQFYSCLRYNWPSVMEFYL